MHERISCDMRLWECCTLVGGGAFSRTQTTDVFWMKFQVKFHVLNIIFSGLDNVVTRVMYCNL